MVRTRQFDENEVLDEIMQVFWRNGYEGTSMHMLEEASGLVRTSLYNAFGNKRAIFERVLVRYREDVLVDLVKALDSTNDIRLGISRMMNAALDMHFDEDNPGGCLIVLAILENENHDAQSRAMLEQTSAELRKVVMKRLKAGIEAGKLTAELDAGAVSTTIASTLAGTMVLGKAGLSKSALKKVVQQVTSLIH